MIKKLLSLVLVLTSLVSLSFAFEKEDERYNYNLLYIGLPAIGLSFLVDEDVKDFVQSNKSDLADKATDFFNFFGSKYSLIIPISTYTASYVLKDNKLETASRVAIISAVISASVVFPLKYITGRERPDSSDNLSFPSGHTALAFAILGSYADYYREGITPYILYATATLTGVSRIYKNKHYLSDVVAGAVIGLSSIYFAKKLNDKISLRWKIEGGFNISQKGAILKFKYKF